MTAPHRPIIDNVIPKVTFNIRGQIYETLPRTLARYPRTLLGDHERRSSITNPLTDEIVVDCSYRAFDAILFYYQSPGILYKPPDIGMEEFLATCHLFEIEESAVMKLCERERYFYQPQQEADPIEKHVTFQTRFWTFLEDPSSSTGAQIYALMSLLLIAVSTVVNLAVTEPAIASTRTHNLQSDQWTQTELGMNSIFAAEYLIRLAASPKKVQFVTEFQNVIDLAAILPYFLSTAVNSEAASNLVFLRAVRTIRVLRVLRFSKQSETLMSVINCLKTCVQEFVVLLMCLFVNCCLCGSIEYYFEEGVPGTSFTSIPQAMWWAIQTIVCLGYGDIIPQTFMGKLFAMMVAIFGVLTLSIPLLSLGSKYVSLATKVFNVSNDRLDRTPTIVRHRFKDSVSQTSSLSNMSVLVSHHT